MTIKGFGIRSIDDSREGVARILARNPGTSVVALSPDEEVVGGILCGHDGRRGLSVSCMRQGGLQEARHRQGHGGLLYECAEG